MIKNNLVKTTASVIAILFAFAFTPKYANSQVTLVYNGKNKNINEAVRMANEILNSKSFYEEIAKVPQFDNSKLTGLEISKRMKNATQEVKIVRKIKPIANASTTTSDKIKISSSLFGKDSSGNFDFATAVNTLIHETVHAVDFLTTGDEFTHNGNSADWQENTAPWIIGAIAEKMILERQRK